VSWISPSEIRAAPRLFQVQFPRSLNQHPCLPAANPTGYHGDAISSLRLAISKVVSLWNFPRPLWLKTYPLVCLRIVFS
jgi:hypothetical protein